MYTYVLSLGSNVGDRYQYINNAIEALQGQIQVEVIRVSSFIETPPWGNTEQAAFINAACLVKTSLEPECFLRVLQGIEADNGRERVIHWGPRTLDLDLIWCENEVGAVFWDSDTLVLPHPYFWERTFVLEPMAELWPDFTYEGQGIEERLHELQQA